MSELIGKTFIESAKEYEVAEFSRFEGFISNYPLIYEVIRIEAGVPLFFEDYFRRMKNSFQKSGKSFHYKRQDILDSIKRLIHSNDHTSGPVKLIFGIGDEPFFLLFLMKPHLPEPKEYTTGVKTILMNEIRDNPNVKKWNQGLRERSVKYMSQKDAYEAVLTDNKGYITEASRSNVFFIRNEEIYTTPGNLILPGITRKKVLEICLRNKIPVNYMNIHKSEIGNYDSCFVTGTSRKIVPVRTMGGTTFEVDTPLLRKIALLFEAYVNKYISEHAKL